MNSSDKEILINLARNSISNYFNKIDFPTSYEIKKKFSEQQGVFVTLKKNKELRGCIGFIESSQPLWRSIMNAAHAAAFNDPRFNPLEKKELKDIKLEISVLTIPKKIIVENHKEYLEKIKINKHGLIIKSPSGYQGLLLPQVATEYNWNVQEFLEHTCEKAMLPKNAWTNLNNDIYYFEVEIFDE